MRRSPERARACVSFGVGRLNRSGAGINSRPDILTMKCAPTFGAIPSAEDQKRKQEEAALVAEKRDEILLQLMNKEVATRLDKLEMDDPAKVR